MGFREDMKAALDDLHSTVVDSIAEEDILLQKILDASGDPAAQAALVQQAKDDNVALRAAIDKAKAAVPA
jgi:hypothetical protein